MSSSPLGVEDFEEATYDEVREKSTEPCDTLEKPMNTYVPLPLEKPDCSSEKPPLPPSPVPRLPPPIDSAPTKKRNQFLKQNANRIAIAAVIIQFIVFFLIIALFIYIGRTAETCKANNEDDVRQLNASIQSIDQAVLENSLNVEANFTRLRNLCMLLGGKDLTANISLLDFVKLTEDIEENFTAVFNRIEQIELDTSRSLNLVNSSLHQVLSERLMTFRIEAHGLVNRSTTEVFEHIESEIAEVRGNIDTQVAEIRDHIDTQVSEVGGYIDSQVLEVREHSDSEDSEVRQDTTNAVNELRRQFDGEIGTAVEQERQYVNTRISHINTQISELQNTAITPQTIGWLTVLVAVCTTFCKII